MEPTKTLRVLIFCLDFETEKFWKAVEIYNADKAYMLYLDNTKEYRDFKKAIIDMFKERDLPLTPIKTTTYKFAEPLGDIMKIIQKEEGNEFRIYVEGPPAYSAAAFVACMMTDAKPFFLSTRDWMHKANTYYKDGKPVGKSLTFKDDPVELDTFPIECPPEDIVRALRVLKDKLDNHQSTSMWSMVEALDNKDLLNMKDKEGEPKPLKDSSGRVIPKRKQNAKMYYKRHYVDKWLEHSWVEKDDYGKLRVTKQGETAMVAFYPEE